MDNKNNNNNQYNINLYNSVFNNIYLKRIIFNHLNKYSVLYNNIKFRNHEEFEQFKYKEYLNNIALDNEYSDLSKLPENIKHIIIRLNKNTINNLKSIPNHLESIKFETPFYGYNIWFSTLNPEVLSKIISFEIELKGYADQIEINKLLHAVTNLKINCKDKIKLKKEMLPSNLKRICISNIESIESECILESLSYARLEYCSPSIINQILSNRLTKLEIINNQNHCTIDDSVIFPESLQELIIQCYTLTAKLPSNLKLLKLDMKTVENTIIFPSSLERILVTKEVFKNRESIPCNLKALAFRCSSLIDNNGQSILPDKLEELTLSVFNQVLQVNQLPSSLTHLNLGVFFEKVIDVNVLPPNLIKLVLDSNKVIDVNVLPPSLKILVLDFYYTQIINPLAIPQQLELLEIGHQYYSHPINLPVSTHPNLLIDCHDINLYYNSSDTSIRKLKLPNIFNSSLSTLQLQDKSSLKYLDLGHSFNQPIELLDLPINNNIKTLKLSHLFSKTINLEYFQNLETIILHQYSKVTIATTTIINQQRDIIYNNYNLRNIIVPPNNSQFIVNLDINFYQFLNITK